MVPQKSTNQLFLDGIGIGYLRAKNEFGRTGKPNQGPCYPSTSACFQKIDFRGIISLKKLARVPLIYTAVAALAVMAFDYVVPNWLANTARIYGQLVIPLMLIALGVSLASLKPAGLPRSLALSVARFAIGLGVGVAVVEFFDLEGVTRGVIILQSAMPAAVFNYMLALQHNNAPPEVAGLVITSTLLSFITLPGLLLFVL